MKRLAQALCQLSYADLLSDNTATSKSQRFIVIEVFFSLGLPLAVWSSVPYFLPLGTQADGVFRVTGEMEQKAWCNRRMDLKVSVRKRHIAFPFVISQNESQGHACSYQGCVYSHSSGVGSTYSTP